MPSEPLSYDDGPLVWVDLEMTGLDLPKDRILEIAVIITNGQLEPVDEGINYILRTPKEVLDEMGEWCTDQHGRSGLTQACIDSEHAPEDVYRYVNDYVRKWVPKKGDGILAGSSVHADARWLRKEMPELMEHLSYRIVDVSSVKELCRRWYPSVTAKEKARRTTAIAHRALDDIKASIRELQFYREHIFIPADEAEAKDGSKSETSTAEGVTEDLAKVKI